SASTRTGRPRSCSRRRRRRSCCSRRPGSRRDPGCRTGRRWAPSRVPRCGRSPNGSWPTSTPTPWTRRNGSSPARPGPWGSRSLTDRPGRCRRVRVAPGRHRPGSGRVREDPVRHHEEKQMKRGKQYRKVAELVDRERLYPPAEAIRLAKQTSPTKFDATVEVAIRLGVDPRKADQMVRGTVNLPHGTGKTVRVIVFAAGEKAAEAAAAGADEVGTDDLVARIQGGWLDFDAAIATPDQMAKIGRIARILGPRGLMPNPKTGTVTMDVAKAVTDIKGGKITF